jgi:hypothetical protein
MSECQPRTRSFAEAASEALGAGEAADAVQPELAIRMRIITSTTSLFMVCPLK